MKKILLVLCLLLLTGCKDNYYVLTLNEKTITVGKDTKEVIEDEKIQYETFVDKKENEILKSISFNVEDINKKMKIDEYELTKGVKETCEDLSGEHSYSLNEACLISKTVKNRENYIIIRGNVLNDDVDEIDNITVGYDYLDTK